MSQTPLLAPRTAGLPRHPGRQAIRHARRWLPALIVSSAVLAPPLRVAASLPDIRVEQLLAVPAALYLAADWRGRRRRPRGRTAHGATASVSLIGAGFLAFGLVTLISVLHAPLLLGSRLSPRDWFEVVKPALYWVLFRFAWQTVAEDLIAARPASTPPSSGQATVAASAPKAGWSPWRIIDGSVAETALAALCVAAILSAGFALAQYLDLAGARSVGAAWAPAHHLRGLDRDGRAFGTFDNPNYFGAMMALVAVVLLPPAAWAARPALRLAARGGMMAGAAGVVLSGSRGALLMLLLAVAVTAAIARLGDSISAPRSALTRLRPTRRSNREDARGRVAGMPESGPQVVRHAPGRHRARSTTAAAVPPGSQPPGRRPAAAPKTLPSLRRLVGPLLLLGLGFAATVVLLQLRPVGRQSYLERVTAMLRPSSDSSIALRLERWRQTGAGAAPPVRLAVDGPRQSTGLPPAPEAARLRDQQRRADLATLVEGVLHERAAGGSLPAGPSLDALVPETAPRLPVDPTTGQPYRYERTALGFALTARIEDPANPDYPIYGAGELVSYVENGDLERGEGDRPAGFRTLAGTAYRRDVGAALSGRQGILFQGNPRQPDQRAAVYQQRAINRAGGAPFTAAVWVRFTVPVQGTVSLYTNVLYADGVRSDPHTRLAADPALLGIWQRLAVSVAPEPGRRIDFIGVYLLTDDLVGEVQADGFMLVDGSVPASLGRAREAAGAAGGVGLSESLRRSPLFGLGPVKAAGGATMDNELILVATRHGLAGLAAYLFLWLATALVALRRWRAGNGLAAGVAGAIAGLLLFSLVAGSFYHLQLMGVFWPVAGVLLGCRSAQRTAD